jgi:hypothetical protein
MTGGAGRFGIARLGRTGCRTGGATARGAGCGTGAAFGGDGVLARSLARGRIRTASVLAASASGGSEARRMRGTTSHSVAMCTSSDRTNATQTIGIVRTSWRFDGARSGFIGGPMAAGCILHPAGNAILLKCAPFLEVRALIETLQCLKKYGQRLDSEIAKETGVPLATVRESLTSLVATGAVIMCHLTRFEKGERIDGWLCRVSGYIPPAAPGRKAKPAT